MLEHFAPGDLLLVQNETNNVAYAMRITDDGAALGISSAWVSSHFNLISTAWSAGN